MQQPSIFQASDDASSPAGRLLSQGYHVVRDFLCRSDVERLVDISRSVRERQRPSDFPGDRYLGLVTELLDIPELAWLIGSTRQYDLLNSIGFSDPKCFMGFAIQKPPSSRGLYWHQDWWGWSDPSSQLDDPPLLVLAYYLTGVTRENGCLRVIPGSHRRRHKLHDKGGLVTDLLDKRDFDLHPLLDEVDGEVDVPVLAGDLLIQDARLLHATHPNRSSDWRSMIFLSVAPDLQGLPEAVQATIEIKRPKLERHWPEAAYNIVAARLARYQGNAKPTPIDRLARPRQ